MFEKIKTQTPNYAKTFIKSLSDVRVLGQVVFVVIVLLVSWSGVKAIQTNFELQKRIAKLEQEVAIAELENQNISLQNQYLETDQFLELAARQQFGKAAPGERVYLVPTEVALRHTVDLEKEKSATKKTSEKPRYQKNLEAWVNFFFRQSDNKLLNS